MKKVLFLSAFTLITSLVFAYNTDEGKTIFSSRKPATVLKAFSGADLSRARFLTRSSKTLDREHRWNNAGLKGAG